MTNNFDEVMSNRTNAELLKILNSPEGDYLPIALDAAKREFTKRNLSDNQVSTAKQEIEADKKIKDEKANAPLRIGWKILTVFFSGFLQLIFLELLKLTATTRKRKNLLSGHFMV